MGMAGAFNLNTYRVVNTNIKSQDRVIVFGEKGFKYFSKKNNLLKYFKLGDKNIEFFNIKYAGDYIARLYLENKFGNVKMVYTKYNNSQPAPISINILPIDKTVFAKQEHLNNFVFEPDKKEIMFNLTSLYVESVVYAGLIESKLSEQTSRKNAMIQANDNIDEMLGELSIQYNKKRQEKITQEVRR
jgi:F-type H+-transporting ATPase subunit gamma